MDQRFADYVRERWPLLVDEAAGDHGDAGADPERALLAGLTRLGLHWWRVRGDPDAELRRQLRRGRGSAPDRSGEPGGYLVMDVTPAGIGGAATGAGDAERAPLSADAAVARVVGAVRRVRRRRAIGVVVVGVVAAAAIGSAIRPGSKSHPGSGRIQVARAVAYPQAPTDFATDVAFGGGYIWTIETRPTHGGSQSYAVERDPVSGRIIARYRVPPADDHIAYGFGKAWTWHDNDDYPTTQIATIDGAGGIEVQRSTPSVAIEDVTFTQRFVWLTEPHANLVLTIRDGVLGAQSESSVSGARYIVPLGPRSVLVAGSSRLLRELPSGNSVSLGATPTLLAPAPSYAVWVGNGRQLSYRTGIDRAPTLSLTLPLDVGAVIGDPRDGVYVATRSRNPRHYDPYLVYYSPAALAAPDPVPTARLDGFVQAETMTANPAGGIVFTTNEGGVDVWNPTSSSAPDPQAGNRIARAGIPSFPRRTPPRGGFA